MTFEQDERNRTTMDLRFEFLAPGPRYRLVVHEWGDYSASDAASAGEPYRPERNTHVTYPNYKWPLANGELGEFVADKRGRLSAKKVFEHPRTSGSPHTITGRSIVIHEVPSEGFAADAKTIRSIGKALACGFVEIY